MPRKHKKAIDKITAGISKQCKISSEPNNKPKDDTTILDPVLDPKLIAKWPKVRMRVPPVFVHKPVEFEQHSKRVLNKGVKYYQPHKGKVYTKITCVSFNDHKNLLHYLDKTQLPYHTYGNPNKRKMKVVIKGLPDDLDLDLIKETLKSLSIPVVRLHKMKIGERRRDRKMLLLVVVPYDDDGKIILRLKKLLGYEVSLEPPEEKAKQCYRCQHWGHAQRYCHGEIRCVKCAGNHWTKKCEKTPEEEPRCANCDEAHTASYRNCLLAHGPMDYKVMTALGLVTPCYKPRVLIRDLNYFRLYRNVDYTRKDLD